MRHVSLDASTYYCSIKQHDIDNMLLCRCKKTTLYQHTSRDLISATSPAAFTTSSGESSVGSRSKSFCTSNTCTHWWHDHTCMYVSRQVTEQVEHMSLPELEPLSRQKIELRWLPTTSDLRLCDHWNLQNTNFRIFSANMNTQLRSVLFKRPVTWAAKR